MLSPTSPEERLARCGLQPPGLLASQRARDLRCLSLSQSVSCSRTKGTTGVEGAKEREKKETKLSSLRKNTGDMTFTHVYKTARTESVKEGGRENFKGKQHRIWPCPRRGPPPPPLGLPVTCRSRCAHQPGVGPTSQAELRPCQGRPLLPPDTSWPLYRGSREADTSAASTPGVRAPTVCTMQASAATPRPVLVCPGVALLCSVTQFRPGAAPGPLLPCLLESQGPSIHCS